MQHLYVCVNFKILINTVQSAHQTITKGTTLCYTVTKFEKESM